MRLRTIASVACGGVLALCTMALAHVGDVMYPIYELSTSDLPDIHDGTLEDWEEAVPGPSLTHDDFSSHADVGDGAPVNPADLAYRVYMAWNGSSQRLFAAIERVDDVYVNGYEGGGSTDVWKYDGFELLVDGDHSGGQYNGFSDTDYTTDERRQMTLSQAQQYAVAGEAADGQLAVLFDLTGVYTRAERMQIASPPFADAGVYALEGSPSLSWIEMYVTPFDALDVVNPELSQRSQLYADKIIGFQISIPDFDAEPGDYHGFYTLAGQTQTWKFAERFVDGLLLPCEGGDCGTMPEPESAVKVDSWGRIKASLR